MEKAYVFGVITHGMDPDEVVEAIFGLEGDLSLEPRAILNPLLTSQIYVDRMLPREGYIARIIRPGVSVKLPVGTSGKSTMANREPEITLDGAYELLVENALAPVAITADERDQVVQKDLFLKAGFLLLGNVHRIHAKRRRYR